LQYFSYTYRTAIDKALLSIQQNPQIKHRRPELSQSHQSFPARRHVIQNRFFLRTNPFDVQVKELKHASHESTLQLYLAYPLGLVACNKQLKFKTYYRKSSPKNIKAIHQTLC